MSSDDTYCDLKADPTLFARVSRMVATSDSVNDVLQTILAEALDACGAERGFLAIADHDRGDLDVRFTAGSGWTEEKRLGRLKVSEETGGGITSRVAATGAPYRSGNVLDDPYYIMFFEDVRSEVAVPLSDGFGRTRGVMNIESTEPDAFTDAHQCALSALADLAVIALTVADHRAREAALVEMGKELSRYSEPREVLQKVIDVAADVLKFEDCSLFLIDVVTDRLVLRASRGPLRKYVDHASYALGEGLTGWTAEHGEPVRIVEPSADPRWKGKLEELPASEVGAYMAVPIRIHRGVIGVMRVQRKRSPHRWFPNNFTEEDEAILTTIASQLGIALDNRRLIDQVVKAERLAAWGDTSARSAHMIGNRLFAIKGDINELEFVLRQSEPNVPEALGLIQSVNKGIFLLEEILNEFREFVKSTQVELEDADLNQLVREAVEEGFPRRSQTRLKLSLAPDLPPIKADPKKLKRCFSELMENSVNFLPEGGEITVTTSFSDARSRKWLKPQQQSGNFVQVRFEDTGPGIEIERKPKIFNPFYSSRAKGMGLGLSIVKGVVDAHDGAIYENGRPGKGARFTILLPYQKSPADAPAKRRASGRSGKQATRRRPGTGHKPA